jgi:hypothetical protein
MRSDVRKETPPCRGNKCLFLMRNGYIMKNSILTADADRVEGNEHVLGTGVFPDRVA